MCLGTLLLFSWFWIQNLPLDPKSYRARNGPQSRRSNPRPPALQSRTLPSELVLPWLYYQYLKNIYRHFYKIFCCNCTFFNLSWKLFDTQIRLRWPIYEFQNTNKIKLHDSIKSIHAIFFFNDVISACFSNNSYQNRMFWKPGIIELHQQPVIKKGGFMSSYISREYFSQ